MKDAATSLTPSFTDPYAGRSGRQWAMVLILALTATIAAIDKTALSLLFDPVKQDLGLSDTQMAFVYGLGFAISNVLFTLPAGYFADRLSRRGMIAVGCAVWSVMTATCGATRSFAQLFLARSALGFTESVIHPGAFSMIQSAVPAERRGRAFGVYSMSTMVGAGFGFLLGGLLLQVMTASGITHLPIIGEVKPWRLVMLALGFGGLPVALLMLLVREPGRDLTAAARSGSFAEALAHIGRNWMVYVPLFAYAASTAMQSNAYGAFVASIPHRTWDIPTSEVGPILGCMQICAAPAGLFTTGLLMDRMQKRFARRGPAIVGAVFTLFTMIFSAAAPFADNPVMYFTLVGCLFFFGGSYFAVTGNIVAMITAQRNMGKTSAVQLFIYGFIGVGAGPAVVGWVSDTVFTGKSAVAPALGWCSGAFNLMALIMILIVVLTIKGRAPPVTT